MIMDEPIFKDGDWRIGTAYNPAHNKETAMLLHSCYDSTEWIVKNYSDFFLSNPCLYCGSSPSEGIQALLRFMWWDNPL